MKKKHNLYALLKELRLHDTEKLIDKGLEYFRSCYQQRRNKYPGDAEFFDLFKRQILKGLNVQQSYENSISIINREMLMLDHATAVGISHVEWWFD